MDLGIELIAFLAVAALAAGFIDAIAGGGGLITIPALLAAGVPPVPALATNKLQSTFGTGGAVLAYARKGHIDFRRFALPTLAAFVGSALGAFLLTRIDPGFLSALLPVLLIAIALYFVFSPRVGDEDRHSRGGPALLLAVALAIGCYDGFFGPGTGSFLTTALVGLFGMGVLRAVAHTKLLNFASNVAALLVLVLAGQVLWTIGLTMAVANALGAQAGAFVAMRYGSGIARPLLVVVTLALTATLLAEPGNPLGDMIRAGLG